MQQKILLKRTMLIATLLGLILLVALLLYVAFKNSTQVQGSSALLAESFVGLPSQEQSNANGELPMRLEIPSINVDASVQYVGLTPDGAMDIPKGPAEVAWFNLGSRPGQIGTAVIAGHYGWKNNISAVFDNLHKLCKGDRISVENKNGVITTFVVRKVQTYDKDDFAPDVFGSNDGKAHLNLVTCTGTWNDTEKTRSDRLVVFADKE